MAPDAGAAGAWPRLAHGARAPVVLAASTREGEEGALLAAGSRRTRAGGRPAPRPLLLLVPRHPQRFDEVARSCRIERPARSPGAAPGLLRMRPGAGRCRSPMSGSATRIGELPLYYACADLALLGGSYGRFGGQNLIEAAACGCPLLIGPEHVQFRRRRRARDRSRRRPARADLAGGGRLPHSTCSTIGAASRARAEACAARSPPPTAAPPRARPPRSCSTCRWPAQPRLRLD